MKLASIEKISDLTPIPNADKIELATILGWQVIVKKNEYKVGDYCVYIPIDTTVDPTREYFKFLASPNDICKRVKIKTAKIRGVFSQGLIIPINEYPYEYVLGQDVSEFFDIQKYEKENFLFQNGTTTYNIPFPTEIINKTDEDNVKTKINLLDELRNKESYITLKMDGSSLTVIKSKDNFIVCSRNLIIEEGHIMYQFINNQKIKDKLLKSELNIAIQGEFCGPKVNGNQIGLKNYKYYVFNIKNLDSNNYYGMEDIKKLCLDLELDMVPIIKVMKFDESYNIQKLQDIANDVQYITSMNKKVPGEGIVIRPINPIWSNTINKYLSFKIINQNYKD